MKLEKKKAKKFLQGQNNQLQLNSQFIPAKGSKIGTYDLKLDFITQK